jgi:Domain of unknown function (DUF6285)
MQDRPTAVELIEAVRDFLAGEVVPALADRSLRYRMRIALHALGIVAREVPTEESRLRAEREALLKLLDLPRPAPPCDLRLLRAWVLEANRALCERIRDGAADAGPWRERVLAHLQQVVEEKLEVSNPGFN